MESKESTFVGQDLFLSTISVPSPRQHRFIENQMKAVILGAVFVGLIIFVLACIEGSKYID